MRAFLCLSLMAVLGFAALNDAQLEQLAVEIVRQVGEVRADQVVIGGIAAPHLGKRQAIEEGFILDVLQNYLSYKVAFALAPDAGAAGDFGREGGRHGQDDRALARPAAITSEKWERIPAPPLAMTGMVTASFTWRMKAQSAVPV